MLPFILVFLCKTDNSAVTQSLADTHMIEPSVPEYQHDGVVHSHKQVINDNRFCTYSWSCGLMGILIVLMRNYVFLPLITDMSNSKTQRYIQNRPVRRRVRSLSPMINYEEDEEDEEDDEEYYAGRSDIYRRRARSITPR